MSEANSPSNGNRLFWASFLTLIAAGVGFSIRGDLLADWGAQFGFTQGELGTITGGGLVGFGITIIAFSFFADKVGYGPLMAIAFLLHVLSAVVTVAATPVYASMGKARAYDCLYWGSFLFALGNGTCEAVINPLTATLYPKNKTHWLNILHAGWPGGLILGALLGVLFHSMADGGTKIRWEIQISMYLIPTLIYGIMMAGQRFPKSEASSAGVSIGTMLLEFASPVLLSLLVLHALVGYVELGTDSWISDITGMILQNKKSGLMLFIWTSGLMFILRFFAGPIVHKISPLGLLFISAVLGATGLTLLGNSSTVTMCILAATVYGFGKTFLWPTMLGVVSERFPKGGAITMGMVGGVGMLSAGLLGGPGIGYKQDYAASNKLKETSPSTYDRYKALSYDEKTNKYVEVPKAFLIFPPVVGLDSQKVATLTEDPSGSTLEKDKANLEKTGQPLSEDKNLEALSKWWETPSTGAKFFKDEDKAPVKEAKLYGGKKALQWTAAVPAVMAVGYLLLILYFKAIGGYKAVHIDAKGEEH
jgi:MFS family permease